MCQISFFFFGEICGCVDFNLVEARENLFHDICAVFGLLGYILKRLQLPIVPIVLGMVLGNIMEQKFRASLARVETPLDFIDRPVSATIFVFIVLALIGQGVSIVRARKTKALSQ